MIPTYWILAAIISICLSGLTFVFYRKRQETKRKQFILTFKLPVNEGQVITVFNAGLDNSLTPNQRIPVRVIEKLENNQILVERIEK